MLLLETVTVFSWESVVIWKMNQTDIHRPTKFPRIICTISSDTYPPPKKIPPYHLHYIIRQISTAPQNSPVLSALYHQRYIHRPTNFPPIICIISSDRYPPPHKIPPYYLHYIIRQISTALQNSPVSSALYHHTSVPCGKNLILERRILFLASTECRFTLRWETRDRVDKTMETLWIPVQISTTSLLSELTDRQKTKFPSPGPHTRGYSTVCYCVLITPTAKDEIFIAFSFQRFRI
jgi:hypothetical protein